VSTNPALPFLRHTCTGYASMVLARRAAVYAGLEFLQFHPPVVYGVGVLITEGARVEGGLSVPTRGGERLHAPICAAREGIFPSRDVSSRARQSRFGDGRGVGREEATSAAYEHLAPACSHAPAASVHRPSQRASSPESMLILKPIPLIPTVPLLMWAAIPDDDQSEWSPPLPRTSRMPVCAGVMSIGEAACVSVHGANRLGTNRLLDLIVFGRAAPFGLGAGHRDRAGPEATGPRRASA